MSNLQVGIVGLPNAGKSTLFNALLQRSIADTTNYPFCTIEPNKGIVEVPDDRLPVLAEIVGTEKILPAAVEFVDIAGLVKGASEGEGLGNQFLANIREVAVILQVVRFFEDDGVVHVAGKVDPAEDVGIINTELILADLQTLGKQKAPRGKMEKEEEIFYRAVEKLTTGLNEGKLAREVVLEEEERELTKRLFLLTAKPVIYVANLSEKQLGSGEDFGKKLPWEPLVTLCAKMEFELAALEKKEKEEYLREYGLEEPILGRLIKRAYATLGLVSFLTAGVKEARAWTISAGMTAREAAGVIHTDFSKNFIKAEIIGYADFIACGGWQRAREAGKVRSEGAGYLLKDGEVVDFKIGTS